MGPSGTAPARRRWRTAIPAAIVGASCSIGAGAALASGGGITPPNPPAVSDAVCISTCGGVHKATADSKVEVSGRHLGGVSKVLFPAQRGGRIAVDPTRTARRTVTAKVPNGAATGRPKVSDDFDNSAKSPKKLRIVSHDQIPSTGSFKLKDIVVKPRKSFYYGRRKPSITYMFSNSDPIDVRVDVVKRRNGTVVDSWVERAQEPNTTHKATWNGKAAGGRAPAPNGGYEFRIGPTSASMDTATRAKFRFYQFKFPVRGKHGYGDGVGAPRAGHTHQGQDVPAACGTKLVAARGGRVQWRAYQAAGAGNYLVIDGRHTKHDYVYMHLAKPSPLHRGQKVHTGQKIGVVGETGDASGCHLHFEEWSAPGWYEGGHFLKSVTRHLRKWDRWS